MKVAERPFQIKDLNRAGYMSGYGVISSDLPASPTLDHHEGFCLEFYEFIPYGSIKFLSIQMYDMKGRVIEIDANKLNKRNQNRLFKFYIEAEKLLTYERR